MKKYLLLPLFLLFFLQHALQAQITTIVVGTKDWDCNSFVGEITIHEKYCEGGIKPYKYTWEDGSTKNSRKNLALGTYRVTITDSSNPPYQTIDINTIVIDTTPDLMKIKIDSLLCKDKVAILKAETRPVIGCEWSTLDGLLEQIPDLFKRYRKVRALKSGTYYVKATEYFGGCVSYDTLVLKLPDNLQAIQATLNSSATTINYGDSVQISLNLVNTSLAKIKKINWFQDSTLAICKGCKALNVKPLQPTKYWAWVKDEVGCAAITDTVSIHFTSETPYNVYLPNAFSPNGDNRNDYFFLYPTSYVRKVNRFEVYDRWGGLLFRREDFLPNDEQLGWDGTFRGVPSVQDNYLYVIEVEYQDDTKRTLNGSVHLIR